MTAISDDAANESRELPEMDESDAAEELLKRFLPPEDAKEPSKEKGEKTDTKSATPDPEPKDPEAAEKPVEGDEEKEEGEEKEEAEAGEVTIRVKVGDQEEDVPASKLARLYGQEKALTQKSMEVADQRKVVEKELATNTAVTNALLTRAQERYKPYSTLDFHMLAAQVGSGELTKEDYQSLRQQAQAAYDDVMFLEQHRGELLGAMQQQQQQNIRQQAIACTKVLTGPVDKGGIEGWNDALYNDIRTFAITQGAPADQINALVEPWAFKLLHNAMLYARGRDKSKVVTTKIDRQPKRIVKTTASPEGRASGASSKVTTAAERLQRTGDTDDAAELMLAKWAAQKADAE